MKKVDIYTDGACSGNPGPGGWGAILSFGQKSKEISGYEEDTTNNRMELKAVVEALKILKEPCEVTIYSDSAYVVNAFTKGWVESWKSNGWKSTSKNKIKNIDLWKELDSLVNEHNVSWEKVAGHSGDALNEKCDDLAKSEIQKNSSIHSGFELPDFSERNQNIKEEIIDRQTVCTGRIVELKQYTVKLPNGKEAKRDVVVHPGAVAIVAINKKNEVYLVRQFRPAVEIEMLEIPAGKLEKDEDPEKCAIRELKEETGITVKELKYLLSIYTGPGFTNEIIHIFLTNSFKEGMPCTDEDEFVICEKIHIDEVLEMIRNHKILDSKTIVGVLTAKDLINN